MGDAQFVETGRPRLQLVLIGGCERQVIEPGSPLVELGIAVGVPVPRQSDHWSARSSDDSAFEVIGVERKQQLHPEHLVVPANRALEVPNIDGDVMQTSQL